jgi:hypothetical protein
MRLGWLPLMILLSGCQRVEPTADVLPPSKPKPRPPAEAPASVEAPLPPPPAPPLPAPPPAAVPSTEAAPAAGMTDAELLAVAMGLDPAAVAKAPPGAAPSGALSPEALPLPGAAPAAPVAPPPAPAWTPDTPLAGTWGVRLVSIVADAQPPRAILGLPSGEEVVVEPGSFVVSEKIVVTAIGRQALQLVRVVPAGDHVRVESETLQPLYGAPRPPSP